MKTKQTKWLTTIASCLLCFTLAGCRSTGNNLKLNHCQGGSCGVTPSADVVAKQTPAQLFASMNYESYAADHRQDAENARRLAQIPEGPDSLFAVYR